MNRTLADHTYKALFHLLFWGLLLIVPAIDLPRPTPNLPKYSSINHIAVTFGSILVFFVNSQVLIPKVFARHGTQKYILSLLGLISSAILMTSLLRQLLRSYIQSPESIFMFPLPIPLFFVAAISSAYGLVVYSNEQERIREAQSLRQQVESSHKLQAELSFLRSQISPHFIFNVLNSLNYLIHKNSPEAKDVVVKLAELMRYMLYETDDQKVKLSTEIEYLNNYIDLQKIRFADDVDIKIDIDVDSTNAIIEPMLLIPFVENAFKHGVATRKKAFIYLRLVFRDGHLHYNVRNSKGSEIKNQETYSGIGLKNIRRRLELLYPNKNQLKITESDEEYQSELILTLIVK
jgi:two-component system, LytTR family, sensor kinase